MESVFDYEVRVAGGGEYHGTLGKPDKPGELNVVGESSNQVLEISKVLLIHPIGKGFRRKIDGSLNSGFSYTQSNKAAQYSLSVSARYRSVDNLISLSGSSIFNGQEGGEEASQHSLSLSPVQLLGTRWASFEVAQFQSNQDQGFDARLLAGGGAARLLQISPKRVTFLTMGPVVNREHIVDSPDIDTNAEILIGIEYYRIRSSRGTPSINVSMNTFTDIRSAERYRIQFSAQLAWEIINHFNFGFNLVNSYDSLPPGGDSEKNDLSLVSSIGYTF